MSFYKITRALPLDKIISGGQRRYETQFPDKSGLFFLYSRDEHGFHHLLKIKTLEIFVVNYWQFSYFEKVE